jgi:HK97 family phage major capsid protein
MNNDTVIEMTKSDLDNLVTEVSNKAVAEMTAKIEGVEKKLAEVKHTNPYNPIQVKEAESFPLGRVAIATAKAHQERKSVFDVLNSNIEKSNDFQDKVALAFAQKSYEVAGKSLGSISTGGGFGDPMTESEYLAVLRPQSVVRQIAGRNIPLIGGVGTYNQGLSGGTAYWLSSDTTALTSTSVTFQQLKMYGKKLAGFTAISNDDIRFDVRGIEAKVQQELLASIGQEEDSKFLTGAGSLGAPTGLVNLTPTANQLTMTATPTAAKAKKDIYRLINAVAGGNSGMKKCYFIMHTTLLNTLKAQTDANSNDLGLARELNTTGTLGGYNVITTNNLSNSYILFVDASDIVIGTGYGLVTDIDTSYGFASDLTYVRGLQTTDIALAYSASSAVLTGVDWSTSLF